jgi:carbon storage regulator
MLVLTRRPEQRVIIGENITVTILEVRGNQIRLGIEAPKEVPISREEILCPVVAAWSTFLTNT